MNRKAQILQALKTAFPDSELTLSDLSILHQNHQQALENGGGHFHLEITSEAFSGLPLAQRHRQVYAVLKNFMKKDIHALALLTRTPTEQSGS